MYSSEGFSPFTMCSNADSVATVSMTKPVRKGYLTRYKKRILGSNWREEWVVLHEDSTLEWYKDHDESDLIGAIMLKEAPEMIAAGPFACYVPNRPELPKNTDPNNMMVFGNKAKDRTHWFLSKNMDDLNQWMTAVSNTLPPPPEQPKPPDQGDQKSGEPPPYTPAPSAPPQQPASNPAYAGRGGGGGGGPTYNPQAGGGGGVGGGYRGGYGGRGGGGGGYGGGYGRGGYGGGGGGQNTVVIDRGGNDGMGFASGMMMGAALSGWGPGYGMGFGGWGVGVGFGVPVYGGFGGYHGGGFHNQETNITNNYNTNNEITNNDVAGDPTAAAAPNPDAGAVDPAIGGGAAPDPEGYNPDAEMIPDGVDPGLLDEGGYEGGYEDMDGMDGGFDMGGMDDMGGGYDMGGGFDMGGFDMGGFDF